MPMRSLLIKDVAADAAQALRSMLEVLEGRTLCRWRLVDAFEDADVVATADFGWIASASARRGKHFIAIGDGAPARLREHTAYVLTHPFRVMQVLAILDEIGAESLRPELRIAPDAPARHWTFAESLRTWRVRGSVGALHTRTPQGAAIVLDPPLGEYACDAAVLEQLRAQPVQLSALTPVDEPRLNPRALRRPALELFWHNAYHASARLAPWLCATRRFHLRRWPDFGTIAATRQQLQVVAALSCAPLSRAQLASSLDASGTEIDRVLNALSLCELLDTADAGTAPRHAQPAAPGFLRAVIDGLRRGLTRAG